MNAPATRIVQAVCLILLSTHWMHAQPVKAPHVAVELVAESKGISVGTPFRVGLRMELEKEWHVYWSNPGDAGMPTTFELTLPEGYVASEIAWPYPSVFGEAPEVSYGYDGVVLLPVTVTPPASARPGDTVRIGAKASWLVCNDVCIPGKAVASLELVVRDGPGERSQWHEEFAEVDGRMPRSARKIDVVAMRHDDHYEIIVSNAAGRNVTLPSNIAFFASDEGVINHSAEQSLEILNNAVVLRVQAAPDVTTMPERLRGLLYTAEGWNGGALKAITVDVPLAVDSPPPPETPRVRQ